MTKNLIQTIQLSLLFITAIIMMVMVINMPTEAKSQGQINTEAQFEIRNT